jgi:hypothetical protein
VAKKLLETQSDMQGYAKLQAAEDSFEHPLIVYGRWAGWQDFAIERSLSGKRAWF